MSNYAEIKDKDIVNGKGIRVSIFFSGCDHHCKGCFNSELWDSHCGFLFSGETISKILEMLKPDYITGLSILGGDPFYYKNRNSVFKLISEVRKRYGETKDIWVWTGYTMSELNEMQLPINDIDVIIDGRFEQDKRDVSLKFRGSSNQKIWYRVGDKLWCTREGEDER